MASGVVVTVIKSSKLFQNAWQELGFVKDIDYIEIDFNGAISFNAYIR